MAGDKDRNYVRATTLDSLATNIFGSMLMVLIAPSISDDNWFRRFVLVYLLAMLLYCVYMFNGARRAESKGAETPGT